MRGSVNTYLMTARRDICGVRTSLRFSIPCSVRDAIPLKGRHLGDNRLPVGKLCSNVINTSFYSTLNTEIMQHLTQAQITDNSEVGEWNGMNPLILIRYKINFLGSWKPYEMKVFLSEPCSPSDAARSTVVEPSIQFYQSKAPEWDPFV